ncbi:MAG: hypothetical protein IJW46_01510 [Clostridia bacterium]|nr:hypothetical protein [Clostridia bacterium]
MLRIIPIQTKDEQETLMRACSIPFRYDAMAYAAYEGDTLVGGAQFYLKGTACYLVDIRSPEGVEDEEALFIMGRGLLNFVDLCGIHDAYAINEGNMDKKLIAKIGFWKNEKGEEYMNLRGFFTSHKH